MKIGAKLAVTMTEQGVINNPIIEITDNKIKGVFPDALKQEADIYVDGVIIPGFISTHTHLHGLLAFGHPVPAPAGFWPFLKKYWWPFIEDVLTSDDVARLAAYASAIHLKNGYTCFLDVMESPNAEPGFLLKEAVAIEATGARAFVSNEATERSGQKVAQKLLKENEQALKLTGKVQGVMSVHTTFSCSSSYIQEAKSIARKQGALFQLHVSEGTYHIEDTLKRFGKRPVHYLNELGVLDEDTVASQCVHLNDDEIKIMAENGVKISHNPVSNMEIGTGNAPLAKMLEEGAKVSLGDDGFIRAFDPFINLSTTLLLHSTLTPGQVSTRDVFELQTTSAAEALRIDAGAIAPGKLADLVILRDNFLSPLLPENVISHMVFGASSSDITHVFVDGRLVVEGGEVKTIDEEALRKEAFETILKIWDGAK